MENDISRLRREGVMSGLWLEGLSGRHSLDLATHFRRLSQLEAPRHSDSWDSQMGDKCQGDTVITGIRAVTC